MIHVLHPVGFLNCQNKTKGWFDPTAKFNDGSSGFSPSILWP